jgi:Pyruvate/2-oxoacid:ferredoxin oxidoreductase delta subunit
MDYKQALFYYFSGTGNSYRTAVWMSESAHKLGLKTLILPLDGANTKKDIPSPRNTLTGIFFPTHGFISPWEVIRFAFSLPYGRGTHAFTIATRGGTKVGPWCIPGFEGTAAYLIALILFIKGYTIRGVLGIDMPANWIAFHWGIHPNNTATIISRARPKAETFIEQILVEKTYFGGRICLGLGLLLFPVSLAYLFIGRFFLAKVFFANNSCTGCKLCAENCPTKAIRMFGQHEPRPYWTYTCESCMRCMAFCPERAIEASHPMGIIFYYITHPLPGILLGGLILSLPFLRWFDNSFVRPGIWYIYFLVSLFLSNLIFIFIMRIRWVNTLFTYTTPTRYYRRYHEPETKQSDLHR